MSIIDKEVMEIYNRHFLRVRQAFPIDDSFKETLPEELYLCFKDAVRVEEYSDSMAAEGDDLKYSLFTYAASYKSNAMGPSVIDPRTGEIIEADIIWWHNVVSLLREWIVVQTGAVN